MAIRSRYTVRCCCVLCRMNIAQCMNGHVKIRTTHHEAVVPIASRNLLKITIQKTLAGTDSNVAPFHSLRTLVSPLLGSFTIIFFDSILLVQTLVSTRYLWCSSVQGRPVHRSMGAVCVLEKKLRGEQDSRHFHENGWGSLIKKVFASYLLLRSFSQNIFSLATIARLHSILHLEIRAFIATLNFVLFSVLLSLIVRFRRATDTHNIAQIPYIMSRNRLLLGLRLTRELTMSSDQ